MTEMVNVTMLAPCKRPVGGALHHRRQEKPITYGYDDKLYVYFRQGPVIAVGGNFGGPGGGPDEGAGTSARSSGRARPAIPT